MEHILMEMRQDLEKLTTMLELMAFNQQRQLQAKEKERQTKGKEEKIAESTEGIAADQSPTNVLPEKESLIPSFVLPSTEKKEESNETLEEEEKDNEEQEIVSSELKMEKDDANLEIINDFVSHEIEKEKEPHSVFKCEEENKVITSEEIMKQLPLVKFNTTTQEDDKSGYRRIEDTFILQFGFFESLDKYRWGRYLSELVFPRVGIGVAARVSDCMFDIGDNEFKSPMKPDFHLEDKVNLWAVSIVTYGQLGQTKRSNHRDS